MKRLLSAKSIAVAALALGAVGAASAAHARSDGSVLLSPSVSPALMCRMRRCMSSRSPSMSPPPVYQSNEQPAYYNNSYYGNGPGVTYVYQARLSPPLAQRSPLWRLR